MASVTRAPSLRVAAPTMKCATFSRAFVRGKAAKTAKTAIIWCRHAVALATMRMLSADRRGQGRPCRPLMDVAFVTLLHRQSNQGRQDRQTKLPPGLCSAVDLANVGLPLVPGLGMSRGVSLFKFSNDGTNHGRGGRRTLPFFSPHAKSLPCRRAVPPPKGGCAHRRPSRR
jgi:hypothetical protein